MTADHRHAAEQWLEQAGHAHGDASWEHRCLAKAQLHATLAVHDELRQLVSQGAER